MNCTNNNGDILDLCNIGVIKQLCNDYGFEFSKSLGQNFLINPTVCPRIAHFGVTEIKQNNLSKKPTGVLEIGTGFGVLTNELASASDKVVAVELDQRLLPILNRTLSHHSNITIINEDILKVDLHKLINEHFDGYDVTVCANLPYYITSPVIMKLLESRINIKAITVMVQKEAAQRLCAPLGSRDCASITFAVNYFSDVKLMFNVSRGNFMPPPNVDSAVIRFVLHDTPIDSKQNPGLEKLLFSLVKSAFAQRRKTMANPVCAALGINKSDFGQMLIEIGAKPTARPEELKMEQWIKLTQLIDQYRREV